MAFLFEKLDVYQKALVLADDLMRLADDLPSSLRSIRDQLKRAAVSIPCNISEGNGRWHKADRSKFFNISRGSVCECATLVDLCFMRDSINKDNASSFKERLEEISKILFVLAKNTDKKRNSR